MEKIVTKNKKAYYEYEILEKHVCGFKLLGSEVKSIRDNKISISEAYCFIDENLELFLKGSNIATYKEAGKHNNHQPNRDRKLLMKKKDIVKLKEKICEKGLTLVPLSVIITNVGLIKLEIGLARGKKIYDKRESIKTKDITRELQRKLI